MRVEGEFHKVKARNHILSFAMWATPQAHTEWRGVGDGEPQLLGKASYTGFFPCCPDLGLAGLLRVHYAGAGKWVGHLSSRLTWVQYLAPHIFP